MIGTIDIKINAAHPNMPLSPVQTFAGSPQQVRIINVPKAIGNWKITAVQITVNYPDNSSPSVEATLTGGCWHGTLPAPSAIGKSLMGFKITASGVDEHGDPITGYVLGKGDAYVLDDDATITVGGTTYYVHMLDAVPESPHKGDLAVIDNIYQLYDGSRWHPLGNQATISWSDITNKPTEFPPEAHVASHKTGGTDALTPADIGAVAAVTGKQLSTNDYTTAEKTKLAGIEAGAEVNPTPVAPSTEIAEGATADAKKVAEFVNSSINAMAAFYITKNAAGDAFATKAELTAAIAAGAFYNGGALRTPTKNDYLYVLADESATPIIPGVAPTTRYSCDGAQWAFQIVVNNTALTSAQVAAINSGMTAVLVTWLSMFKGGDTSTTLASVLSAIAGKLDKSGDTMTGNLEVTNTDGYPKVLVGDSGGDYAEYQKDGIFTNKGWIGFGAKNGTASVEEDFTPSAPAAYVGTFVQKAVRYQEVTPANTALSEAAINILTTAGQTYTLPTLAAGEKRVRDFLLYVNTTAAAFAINFPSGTQLLGDNPSITEAGEYIITMTAMPSGKWYVRKIKMEVAQ